MATSGKLIQVKDLRKHYNKGAIKALDGVSVDINLSLIHISEPTRPY